MLTRSGVASCGFFLTLPFRFPCAPFDVERRIRAVLPPVYGKAFQCRSLFSGEPLRACPSRPPGALVNPLPFHSADNLRTMIHSQGCPAIAQNRPLGHPPDIGQAESRGRQVPTVVRCKCEASCLVE